MDSGSPGSERWRFTADDAVSSSPTIINETVYVGDDAGHLHALQASTGQREWLFDVTDLDGEYSGRFVYSSPAVADGVVYFELQLGTRGRLVAVDARTGNLKWTFENGSTNWTSATLSEETVFFGDVELYDGDSRFYAVDRATGTKRWERVFEDGFNSSPTVVDDTVYVGCDDGHVYAFETETGERRWAFGTDDQVRSSPTVVDGTVYVGSDSGRLYAIDARTGDRQWRVDQEGGPIRSSPTVADGTVYVGVGACLEAIDAETGERDWQFETGGPVTSSPTVAGSTAYVGSRDDRLYAVDAATGTENWSFGTGDQIRSAPTVKDGTAYVGGEDGTVYAVTADLSDADSRGSRVLLGTLGHHDGRTTDGREVDERVSEGRERASPDSPDTNVFDRPDERGQSGPTSNRETNPTGWSSHAAADGVNFCPHCGADLQELPEGRYCSNCGEPLRVD
ncbi:PQQ-binding-like beta-propeller repeat protein [Halorubrum yunnanense]|uniref:PQQ-binding-like beta-propeller repeat protein n=1 Tax=Halorubrum yunnanense TaxID=1526162 RepID=A0ABD5YAU9_9EURY|nr:PQQ-binding-like beta-propeller repeat protein [Halorubrum yunnanense]